MPSSPGSRSFSASPLPTPSVGKTFLTALVLLGLVALGQIGTIAWRVRHGLPFSEVAPAPVRAIPEPVVKKPVEVDLTVAAEAERRLVAGMPRPTPVPVRRPITPETRVADLINLARALRDRGDTTTALTRLREAQAIAPRNCQIVSEMALTYEKMGLSDKAVQQWRRIYEMGEQAGIYYAAAEAKLRTLQLPDPEVAAPAPASLMPVPLPLDRAAATPVQAPAQASGTNVLSLGQVGTVDDTGNSQRLRRLRLRVPIIARAGAKVDVRDAVIQVFFYEQVKDGSIVETNANVSSSWVSTPVDWSDSEPEVLDVEYAQAEPDPGEANVRRNYFGYIVRVYYKSELNAAFADPVKLLKQFPPPATLSNSDLPQ